MKYVTNHRINVRTIRNIADNQGLTLRNGKIVKYKSGWQVGITGITCKTPEEVKQDAEGMQTMRQLARNMAWMLKCIEAGRKAGVALPEKEDRVWTNFIR